MIQPPVFLLQQQVALKTARRVAVSRGASFADFLPATDKIRAKVRAVRPPFVQIHFGFPRLMKGKALVYYLICACASIAEQICITRIR
jgi:hypothetical protein